MERSSQVHAAIVDQPEAYPPDGQHDVGVLGRASAGRAAPLHPEAITDRPSGSVTQANVLRLLEWQRFRCALTGRSLMPDTASLDHIVPVRCGGDHLIENVQVLHKEVNRAKTTMTNEEFVNLCREVVAHVGRHPEAAPTDSERNMNEQHQQPGVNSVGREAREHF